MTDTWLLAALGLGLQPFTSLFSMGFRIATALPEIVVGHCARTLFERGPVGAVAKYVINHARDSVLAARYISMSAVLFRLFAPTGENHENPYPVDQCS